MAYKKTKENGGNVKAYRIIPNSWCEIGNHTYYFAAKLGDQTGRLCVDSRIPAKDFDDWLNYISTSQSSDWSPDTVLVPATHKTKPNVAYWVARQPLYKPGMTLVPYTHYIQDQIEKPDLNHHLQHMLEILANAERRKVDCNVLYIPETKSVLIHFFPAQTRSKIITDKITKLSNVLQVYLQERHFKNALEVYDRFSSLYINRLSLELLSDKYLYFPLPEICASTIAVNRATHTRVLVERYDGNKQQLHNQYIYCAQQQKHHPILPQQGLCLLHEVLDFTEEDSFLIIRDVMDTNGFLPVGHPDLLALPMKDRLIIARNMLSVMDHVIQAGWLPTQILESHMLVNPKALEVCFADGHLLHRDPPEPLVCTLGYQEPKSYYSKHRVNLTAINYAIAVWLYRLFVGGYPLEGRHTLAILREIQKPEREIAEKLYGAKAVFAFDSTNLSNRPDPNCKRQAEQTKHWQNAPSQLRTGWEQTFSKCLHHNDNHRWAPRQWLVVVNALLDD